jgi:NAD(P)-dependent dehydrogenase (short-subunit alcohol dehydrogenase family)
VTDPRRALITGASRGIGRGIAEAFGAAGYRVALAARDPADLEETAVLTRAAGATAAVSLPTDVGDLDAARALPSHAAEALGGSVEILVHCAGIARNGPVGELSMDDWEDSLRVNVTALFVLAGEIGPAMAAAGWGRIVSIGSLYARFGVARTAAYTTSKHAVLGLTRVLAAELVKHRVTANCVIPGWVDTEMVRSQADAAAAERGLSQEQIVDRFLRDQPIGRMVTTEEVGALVAFLASDAAAPITGQAINIDGGSYQS